MRPGTRDGGGATPRRTPAGLWTARVVAIETAYENASAAATAAAGKLTREARKHRAALLDAAELIHGAEHGRGLELGTILAGLATLAERAERAEALAQLRWNELNELRRELARAEVDGLAWAALHINGRDLT